MVPDVTDDLPVRTLISPVPNIEPVFSVCKFTIPVPAIPFPETILTAPPAFVDDDPAVNAISEPS